MTPLLVDLRRVQKPTGSVYLHCWRGVERTAWKNAASETMRKISE